MKYSVVVSGAFHRVEIKISKCSEKLTFPTKKKLVYSFVVFFCSGGNVEVKKTNSYPTGSFSSHVSFGLDLTR